MRSKRFRTVHWVVPILALFGLYWFSASFFLAKKSLSHLSTCDEAPLLLKNILGLNDIEVQRVTGRRRQQNTKTQGCWLSRRVDSMVILVVDALRFDFAEYELPLSIGSRIRMGKGGDVNSQLLQFVADPPTVTMQRLKGLTTGSLPTFADISGNFGGSTIEEDNWVDQLKTVSFTKRGLSLPSRLGFVGDDTWVDLFPTQFEESYPYPSFNTRDLDTVDNGCLKHLPGLLEKIRTTTNSKSNTTNNNNDKDQLEVLVAHFLGVDHVGHTYGPHNQHMHQKLQQMDIALSQTLDILDESQDTCHLALIFGDHGMTEDGNHGGGTEDEVNAALFVHFSPGCKNNSNTNNHNSKSDGSNDASVQSVSHNIMGSKYIQEIFQSIHQIDLVPTISILLGLPIPYQNIGGIVPSLLSSNDIRDIAAALALNAAQVWRYFTVYSETANKLPNLNELEEQLNEAVSVYKEALEHNEDAKDSDAFYKACGLFKIFLVEASDLGHRVWTRFDTIGMISGGMILLLAVTLSVYSLYFSGQWRFVVPKRDLRLEVGYSVIFIVYHCVALSFSNSYILAEQRIVMFIMAILGTCIFARMNNGMAGNTRISQPYIPLLVPILSRCGEIFVSGHGADPSIRLHLMHNPLWFLSALACLLTFRILLYQNLKGREQKGLFHTMSDSICVLLLAISWIERRNTDPTRNGFGSARAVVFILLFSTPLSIINAITPTFKQDKPFKHERHDNLLLRITTIVAKLLLAMMLVTGPSTAATCVLFTVQVWMLYRLGETNTGGEVPIYIQSFFWRLIVRHVFFATNHGCAFNRLQYSAAFVTKIEFDFVTAGIQLFLNTFGKLTSIIII